MDTEIETALQSEPPEAGLEDETHCNPPAGTLVGHVNVCKRYNKDRSRTLIAAWRQHNGEGRVVCRTQRIARTGPKPTNAQLRDALHDARVRAREIERVLRDEAGGPPSIVRRTILDSIADYIDFGLHRWARSTYDQREAILLNFAAWLAETAPNITQVHHIVTSRIEDWVTMMLADRNYTRPTLNCYLSAIRQWMAFCLRRDWVRSNPVLRLDHLRTGPRKERPTIPDETVRRLVAEAPEKIRLMTALLFVTGLRVGEATSAFWEDIDLDARELRVRGEEYETTKRHARTLPIGPGLAAMVAAAGPKRGHLMFRGRKSALRRLMAPVMLGDQHATPHDTRRWFATAVAEHGASEWVVRHLMGHTQPGSLSAYVDAGRSDPRACMEALDELVLG